MVVKKKKQWDDEKGCVLGEITHFSEWAATFHS